MGKVQQAQAWFADAAVVECVENTYIPKVNGTLRTIEKVGKSFADCRLDGKPYRMEIPARAGDIVAMTGDTITYKIGRDEHTVTLRKVS